MPLIPLTQGLFARVDPEFAYLANEKWCVKRSRGKPYAYSSARKQMMHRLIMETPDDMLCDHRLGNTLDNRKRRLRNVTPTENKLNVAGARVDNKLGILGVHRTRAGKFMARIMIHGKSTCLGTFPSVEEARLARLSAERTLHGVQPRRAHLHG